MKNRKSQLNRCFLNRCFLNRCFRGVTFGMVLGSMVFSMSGCGNNTGTSFSQTPPNQTTTSAPVDVADGMDIAHEENKEFYVINVKDRIYEINLSQYYVDSTPQNVIWPENIYLEKGGAFPEIKDGQVAKVIADVAIYNGGEDGFCNTIFIQGLKKYEVVDYSEVIEKFDIQDVTDHTIDSDNHILKYQEMNDIYLLVFNGDYVEVYKDNELYAELSAEGVTEMDHYTPFFDKLKADKEEAASAGNATEADAESAENGVKVDGYWQITQEEAVRIMEEESDYIILDVRGEDEYYEGHIPKAINIPNEFIEDKELPELPDKDQKILVYCRSGRRSKAASKKLAAIGYTNVYEFGGINEWTGEVVEYD